MVKTKQIPRAERFCRVCNSGQVEDEYHFLIECVPLDVERQELWSRIDCHFPSGRWLPAVDRVELLLGKRRSDLGLHIYRTVDRIALCGVYAMYKLRNRCLYND